VSEFVGTKVAFRVEIELETTEQVTLITQTGETWLEVILESFSLTFAFKGGIMSAFVVIVAQL
jgi:hypothetical protein